MKKNTSITGVPPSISQFLATPEFTVIKASQSDFYREANEIPLAELDKLNELARTAPFCITHRVKKFDVL